MIPYMKPTLKHPLFLGRGVHSHLVCFDIYDYFRSPCAVSLFCTFCSCLWPKPSLFWWLCTGFRCGGCAAPAAADRIAIPGMMSAWRVSGRLQLQSKFRTHRCCPMGQDQRTLHPIEHFFFNLQNWYHIEDFWGGELGVGEEGLEMTS